jgi:hypothetical protein
LNIKTITLRIDRIFILELSLKWTNSNASSSYLFFEFLFEIYLAIVYASHPGINHKIIGGIIELSYNILLLVKKLNLQLIFETKAIIRAIIDFDMLTNHAMMEPKRRKM